MAILSLHVLSYFVPERIHNLTVCVELFRNDCVYKLKIFSVDSDNQLLASVCITNFSSLNIML